MSFRYCVISTSTNYVAGISSGPTPPPYYYTVASDIGQVTDYYDGADFYEWVGSGAPNGTNITVPDGWILRPFGQNAATPDTKTSTKQ